MHITDAENTLRKALDLVGTLCKVESRETTESPLYDQLKRNEYRVYPLTDTTMRPFKGWDAELASKEDAIEIEVQWIPLRAYCIGGYEGSEWYVSEPVNGVIYWDYWSRRY